MKHIFTAGGKVWNSNRKGVGGLVRPRDGFLMLSRSERRAPVSAGATGGSYPHEPTGMTPFWQFNGSPRENGSNEAFGFAGMSQWFWESPRTEDDALIVTADATNPTGSNNVLRLNWKTGLSTVAIKAAKTDPSDMAGGPYTTLYVMLRIFWETDNWDEQGTKLFYVGLPTSDKHFYFTRDVNGGGILHNEGYTGSGDNLITLPTGVFVDGVWNSIEFVCHAQSAPGVHDGAVEWYNNGSLVGSVSGVTWGDGSFGTLEYYGTTNSIPTDKHYRIGELYLSGK